MLQGNGKIHLFLYCETESLEWKQSEAIILQRLKRLFYYISFCKEKLLCAWGLQILKNSMFQIVLLANTVVNSYQGIIFTT